MDGFHFNLVIITFHPCREYLFELFLSVCIVCIDLYCFEAFLPLLKKAAAAPRSSGLDCRAAVVNVSSAMGVVRLNDEGRGYAYRSSKVTSPPKLHRGTPSLDPAGGLSSLDR